MILACDGMGGDTLARSLGAVRPFGTLASLGQTAGPIPPVPVEQLGPSRSIALARPSVMAYSGYPQRYCPAAGELLPCRRAASGGRFLQARRCSAPIATSKQAALPAASSFPDSRAADHVLILVAATWWIALLVLQTVSGAACEAARLVPDVRYPR